MSYCVYAVGVTGHFVKFGYAKNINNRISQIQTGCPVDLFLLSKINVKNAAVARTLEQRIHHVLKNDILRGEWFKYTQLVRKIVCSLETCSATQLRVKLSRMEGPAGDKYRNAAQLQLIQQLQEQNTVTLVDGYRRRFQ